PDPPPRQSSAADDEKRLYGLRSHPPLRDQCAPAVTYPVFLPKELRDPDDGRPTAECPAGHLRPLLEEYQRRLRVAGLHRGLPPWQRRDNLRALWQENRTDLRKRRD